MDWSALFEKALNYHDFLSRHGSATDRAKWNAMYHRIALTEAQKTLISGFKRRMPVLCLSGAWCGDCVHQCPIFEHFAQVNPKAIDLRFLDRDEAPSLRDALAINGGHRVPVLVFLSEDFQEVARFGDRTLARYLQLAAEQLGPACPTGIVPPGKDVQAQVVAEWLDQFERAQLILRLSPRLRKKYGD